MPNHILQLTYQEFQSSKKTIANTLIDKYIIYERIGQGAFGSVYRGMDDTTKKQIAVKVLDLVSIEEDQKNPRVKQIRRRLAKTESEMMMKCDSPHVMKCYDVYENKDLKIMMIEYCNGGTLADMLGEKGRIPQKQAIDIIKQIIFGIAEMHKHNIIHRDLKSQNIMFHNSILKIVDLGFSKTLPGQNSQSISFGTTLGTIITMAPQVMRKQKYGLKADIWSIGIILYEIVYGKIPYQPMRAPDMYEQIINKNIFPNGGKISGLKPSQKMLDFMKRILVIDQQYRMSWKQFLDHPILHEEQEMLSENFRVSRNIQLIKKENLELEERTQQMVEEPKNKINNVKNQSVPLKWVDQKFGQKKKQQINKDDENVLKWVKQNHLQCLKTQFIFNNIILPIEQRKSLNLKTRNNVQFLYLLIARCFFNMSFINHEVSKNQDQLVISLKESVSRLYAAVEHKFSSYCKVLNKIQSGFGEIMKDRFGSIFNSQERKMKDKFLVGVEVVDYKKEEQIQYTTTKYAKDILKNQLDNKDIKLRKYLEKYRVINFITLDQLKNKTLNQKIKEIVS